MIGPDFASTFGSFGEELSERIRDKVTRLGELLDDREAFDAAYAEIAEIADEILDKHLEMFARTVTGFIAFHAQNNLAMDKETPTEAMAAAAINVTRLLTHVNERVLVNVERYLFAEADEISRIVGEVLADFMNPDEWTETTAEHPLTDLFPGKPVA